MIDVQKGNQYIAQIMIGIRDSISVGSNRRQAEIMGLGYGTVQSLLNPSPAVRNLPDHRTLEAIADYRGLKLWEFLREIEESCPKELSEEDHVDSAIAHMNQVETLDGAIEVVTRNTSHLNKLFQAKKA